jgi:sugar transport protein
VATTANWASNLVVSLTFLSLIEGLGTSTTFLVYGAVTVLAIVFRYRLVPETKGHTLEELDLLIDRPQEIAADDRGLLRRKLTDCRSYLDTLHYAPATPCRV